MSIDTDIEYMIIEIKYKQNSISLVNMYRPPNLNLTSSVKEITHILSHVAKLGKPMVVCTDHNIDLLKASTHTKTQDFLENCVELNLLPSITKPTRITHSGATLIDNIFLSARLHEESMSWIIVEDMSDHFPCLTSIPYLCPDNSIDQYITKRKLTDKVYNKINQSLN